MKKKFIVVLGGGESGVGAALLAKKNGLKIFISDSGIIMNKYKKILKKNEIIFEEKGHTENFIIEKATEIIKSPGICKKNILIKKINSFGIPILSELEFGKSYLKKNYLISITGSNGKTTTTSIVYKILKKEGINVGIAGNIGRSFSKEVLKKKDIYVLEVSSFQLDDCYNFRSNIAVLLNITRDHLNRYDNIENYIYSKFKIALFQKKKDIFIYNHDDPIIRNGLKKFYIKSNCIPFSIKEKLPIGAYLKDKKIWMIKKKNTKNKEKLLMDINNISLIGDHNLYNIMASLIISEILNVKKESIISILSKLKAIEHRMEKVLNVNGVYFINDSKATNVNAVFYALQSINKPIIWIAGGEDKGNNYQELIPLVKEKVKAIICLGINNEKIIFFFKNIINIILETISMKNAIKMAYELSLPGCNVLLSPACSSFDLFKNYKEKGNKFKKEVKKFFIKKNEKNRDF
ncbi:UDP-N-acetylmuramoyl-L-alanine--D-glutamate ligase [Blattabacterium cuenoti]|uniref:UDP-N-acetylmuramoyl-L-alanine--D-glutamate ligase n=1 Tax=Blattabacterium cuenoti TaxID=1653831 RepID=UPI00163C58C8|nr:UDP-N-acetylmuramoyl-L-alanine--D-glutamate ligase [Blattabacterium cuenoti]